MISCSGKLHGSQAHHCEAINLFSILGLCALTRLMFLWDTNGRVIHREYQQFWGPWAAPGFIRRAPKQVACCKIFYLNPVEAHFLSASTIPVTPSHLLFGFCTHSLLTQVWVFDLSPSFPLLFCYRGTSIGQPLPFFRIPISSLCPQVLCSCHYSPFSCENMGIFMNISPLSPVSWIFHLLWTLFHFSIKHILCCPTSMTRHQLSLDHTPCFCLCFVWVLSVLCWMLGSLCQEMMPFMPGMRMAHGHSKI